MRRESTRQTDSAGRTAGRKRKYGLESEKKEERQYGFSERIYLRIL